MCVGLTPLITGIIALNLDEDSIIPMILLPVSFIVVLLVTINVFKVKKKEQTEDEDIKE